MRPEKVITALLNGAVGVTALVGSGAAARIYPGIAPQGVGLPLLSVEHVSGGELPTLDAAANYGLAQARVQVTAVAGTYPEVKALLEQVRLACRYQRGAIAGVSVVSVLPDVVGPDQRDDALGLLTQSRDFLVTFKEE